MIAPLSAANEREKRDLAIRRGFIGAAAAMVVGVIGPWYIVNVIIAQYAANGFSAGPGLLVLLSAIVAGFCAVTMLQAEVFTPSFLLIMAVAFGIGFLLAAKAYLDVQQGLQLSDVIEGADINVPTGLFVHVGWGLWLTLLSSLAGVVGAGFIYRERRTDVGTQ